MMVYTTLIKHLLSFPDILSHAMYNLALFLLCGDVFNKDELETKTDSFSYLQGDRFTILSKEDMHIDRPDHFILSTSSGQLNQGKVGIVKSHVIIHLQGFNLNYTYLYAFSMLYLSYR